MDRKKIIGIFGGFLAVMLMFTMLSRAVTGASLARVETVRAVWRFLRKLGIVLPEDAAEK